MTSKPRVLVISHVKPFPGKAGQQQRVKYKLLSMRWQFHVTFLTYAHPATIAAVKGECLKFCDEAIVLPSVIETNILFKAWHVLIGWLYVFTTGLKLSNYIIGHVELSLGRIKKAVGRCMYDAVLYEYWHAHRTVSFFKKRNIPTVLDMHDVLYQSYKKHLSVTHGIPEWWKQRSLQRYKQFEENAWRVFDAIIAINKGELEYLSSITGTGILTTYIPMGVDLSLWSFNPLPASPPRIGYYGGMGNTKNQEDAERCLRCIMPLLWKNRPEIEFWVIGGDPPERIKAWSSDSRVHVTGFVENVADVLHRMSLVLCPFNGTFGFRSRLIEVMALGIPVVASNNAVYGMELEHGRGIFLGETDEELASLSERLLGDDAFTTKQRRIAREEVERKYGLESSYQRFPSFMVDVIDAKSKTQ